MNTDRASATLASGWIEAWARMDMAWLRGHLAADFVHVSPFGRLEGRDLYLETVEPMARKSVMELRILDVLGDDSRAAVRFENRTPRGVVESCDWIFVNNGLITEIRSYYDSSRIREVLSPGEQDSLGG